MVEIDQTGAADPQQRLAAQRLLGRAQRRSQKVRFRPHVQSDVVALGTGGLDLIGVEHLPVTSRPHDQARPPGNACRAGPLQVLERRLQRLLTCGTALGPQAPPDPLDGVVKARRIKWLQQVIRRAEFERLRGVAHMRRDEDHHRRSGHLECTRQRHAVERIHLDVEEDRIGTRDLHGLQRRVPVSVLPEDL